MMIQLTIFYLIGINLLALCLFGLDKWKARRSKWRISEATLLGTAFLGGSIGAICGMKWFHHKTLHKKFYIGLPVLLTLQIAAAVFYFSQIF